jgi:hypothetical protein
LDLKDQRTKSADIFGAICPAPGKSAGLILPFCSPEIMSLHLTEISLMVAPGARAVVLMDQAGACGRPEQCKRYLEDLARNRMLPSVRPLMQR